MKVFKRPRAHLRIPPHTPFSSQTLHFFTTFCLYVEIYFYTAEGPGPCHEPLV